MAVGQTGAIFKALEFDGVSSRTYGVYITGEAVYNAPERAVQMIEIPGRNGAFALDEGRFENIEVTYPAGIFADTEADFAAAVSDFRNVLCSKLGYCRLTDEYNPDEYRLAIYKSGLEVSPAQLRAGEFEIVFECKPQRFLTSGETAVPITSGGTITNPTLFSAGPLLEIEGYGETVVNDKTITLTNIELGDIVISNGGALPLSPNYAFMNIGDVVKCSNIKIEGRWYSTRYRFTKFTIISETWTQGSGSVSFSKSSSGNVMYPSVSIYSAAGQYGTESAIAQGQIVVDIEALKNDEGIYNTTRYILNVVVKINAVGDIVFDSFTYTATEMPHIIDGAMVPPTPTCGEVVGTSTVTALGHPTFVDCENGDAYKVENGEYISLNHVIDLGSELPTLSPGANVITYDNTIISLKVKPQWWKV